MRATEFLTEGGEKKAYDMGFDDGYTGRPKKGAGASFGPYANDYYKGYSDGQDAEAHEAWQEKTAAKRQGRYYHESGGDQYDDMEWGNGEMMDEPQDDDGFIQDNTRGGYDASVEGKFIGNFGDVDEA